MTREEAINTVRNIYQTDKEKEALEILIPELAESEDEKTVRLLRELGSFDAAKELYEEFNLSYTDVLYWLEKQKDANKAIEAVEKIDKYIDENVANAHDMKDSNPEKKYYRGWDDALGAMAGILQDVYSGEKQKEQKPLTAEETELNSIAFLEQMGYTCIPPGKEQKPAEKQDYSGLDDLERAILRGFLSAGVENVSVTIIKETAKECLAQMKPAEWSDEDDKILDGIITTLDRLGYTEYCKSSRDQDIEEERIYYEEIQCLKKLKSLRPQSK